MKALVIREPWIGLILEGHKTWEMRSRPTKIRGRIALAHQGTGLLVGTAELVEVRAPLTIEGLMRTRHLHGIPLEQARAVAADGWLVPWVLADVRRFAQPAPYAHPRGAVTWVNVSDLGDLADRAALSESTRKEGGLARA